MTANKEYSAVIVEYNSGDYLFSCIDSLMNQTLLPKKIVVVNNGTSRTTLTKLQKYDRVHVINPSKNLGYANAANLGIANTETEIVATLNPDINLDPDCAQILVEYLKENNRVAVIGPMIFQTDGSIYPSARKDPSIKIAIGHAIFSLFKKNNRFSNEYRNSNIEKDLPSKVDWLSGAALFLQRKPLDEVGLWDERYFMYCEDIDLCNSFREKGYDCIYEPRAKIVHAGGISTSKTPIKLLFFHHKSLYLYTVKKYHNKPIIKPLALVFIGFRFPFAVIKRNINID